MALMAREAEQHVTLQSGTKKREDGTFAQFPNLGSGRPGERPSFWITQWHQTGTAVVMQTDQQARYAVVRARCDASDALRRTQPTATAAECEAAGQRAEAAATARFLPPEGHQRLMVQVRHHAAYALLVHRLLVPAPPEGMFRLFGRPCTLYLAPPTGAPPAVAATPAALWDMGVLSGLAPSRVQFWPTPNAAAAHGTLELDAGAAALTLAGATHWRYNAQTPGAHGHGAWRLGPPPLVTQVLKDRRVLPKVLSMAEASVAMRAARKKDRDAQEKAEATRARDQRQGQKLLTTLFTPAKPVAVAAPAAPVLPN
jgi:hypothetical protein